MKHAWFTMHEICCGIHETCMFHVEFFQQGTYKSEQHSSCAAQEWIHQLTLEVDDLLWKEKAFLADTGAVASSGWNHRLV